MGRNQAFEAVCRLGKLQEQLEEVQGLEKERRGVFQHFTAHAHCNERC